MSKTLVLTPEDYRCKAYLNNDELLKCTTLITVTDVMSTMNAQVNAINISGGTSVPNLPHIGIKTSKVNFKTYMISRG